MTLFMQTNKPNCFPHPIVNFRPTALRVAILSLATGLSLPAIAVTTTQVSDKPATLTRTDTVASTDTNPDNHTDNAPNQSRQTPYQYQLPNQPIADHISQQIANQTLTPDFNNFNQPVATLKQNQPSVGFNQKIANQKLATPPTALDPNNALNSEQAIRQAQVIEQLGEENPTSQPTPTQQQQLTQHNATTQTDNIDVNATINPEDYLPEYQKQTASVAVPQQQSTVTASTPNPLKRLYNRVLNKAQGANYLDIKIANADEDKQPAKNIKAALEQVTVESVADFLPSIGKLRQIATDAAQAVGYYDTQVSFRHLGSDKIEVTVKAGEPVTVASRVVDIRGEGGEGDNALSVYPAIEADIPPKVGDVFNHGLYKTSKATIEGVALTNGFFDAKWLNNSADIILPDNTADVALVYDTQQRYHFGDVKVYSIDKDGKLTDNPDKLPIKPELLKQLMTYQNGDPYYQPFVTEFANNLSATRYFNAVDMDVVLPQDKASAKVRFDTTPQTSGTVDNPSDPTDKATTDTITGNKVDDIKNAVQQKSDAIITSLSEQSDKATLATTTQNPQDIAPINFEVDATTTERLTAISNKALNLMNAPEDIQLAPTETNNSKNPLAIIANGVSKLAKKIDHHADDTPLLLAQAQRQDPIDKQTPEQVYQQKTVPTYVVLNANKPHEAQVGIGYETDVGMRVTGKIKNNLVNRNGLQAGINIAASRINQSIEVNASYPYKHPLNDKITGVIGYQHNNSEKIANTFESESLYGNIARNIYNESGWNRTYSLRYRDDKLNLGEGKYTLENLPYPFNHYASGFDQQSLLVGYALNKTVADNRLSPTYGYSQRYSIEAGVGSSLDHTSMAKLKAGATGLYSFGEQKKHQVLGRLDLGYIYSDDFINVPYRERFFAGGDNSIRGYGTDTLAPQFGEQGFLMGGDALAVGSLEYNYQFRPGLRAALFSDFGNAYDTSGDYRNDTKASVGAGVRWASPIGTVRLDVATGLSEKDDPYRIHFFIGSPL